MKRLALAPLLALLAAPARAETVSCSFTEPFYTLEIDTDARTITRIAPNWEAQGEGDPPLITTVVARDVKFKHGIRRVSPLRHAPTYEVRGAGGKALLTLELTYEGTDGMSERVYPYAAIDLASLGGSPTMHGGCSSTALPVLVPETTAP